MLTLPIKKKWFDMILSGEKKEEYRNITPYYETRCMNLFGVVFCGGTWLKCSENGLSECAKDKVQEITFRNGYRKDSPSFIAKCTLSIGEGKEAWGAVPGKEYFRFHIEQIIRIDGIEKKE